MPDYKKMYHRLFSATTNAITILQEAQLDTEALFANTADEADIGETAEKDLS